MLSELTDSSASNTNNYQTGDLHTCRLTFLLESIRKVYDLQKNKQVDSLLSDHGTRTLVWHL